MIYAPWLVKVFGGMILSIVGSALVLLLQGGPSSNNLILILSPVLGCIGVIITTLVQNWRQRSTERAHEKTRQHDTEAKAAGVDADERKDARAVLLQIIAQQNESITHHGDELRDTIERANSEREELVKSYCVQIAGLQSTINLQKEALSVAQTLAATMEQIRAAISKPT